MNGVAAVALPAECVFGSPGPMWTVKVGHRFMLTFMPLSAFWHNVKNKTILKITSPGVEGLALKSLLTKCAIIYFCY